MNTIHVPYKEMGCETNCCHSEVAKKVKAYGGKAVYCWLMAEMRVWTALSNHSLYQSPYGELVCVTPQYGPDDIIDTSDRVVVIDETAKPVVFEDRLMSLPTRYIPKVDAKWCRAACEAKELEGRLTNEALFGQARVDYTKLATAKDAWDKANYWISKGTKGQYEPPINDWLLTYLYGQAA